MNQVIAIHKAIPEYQARMAFLAKAVAVIEDCPEYQALELVPTGMETVPQTPRSEHRELHPEWSPADIDHAAWHRVLGQYTFKRD